MHSLDQLRSEYANRVASGVQLDLTRGKPNAAMLASADALLTTPISTHSDGVDVRNYGAPLGLPAARALASDIIQVPAAHIAIGSNSSMQVMQNLLHLIWFQGLEGGQPWRHTVGVKVLCPVPGYDRHFALLEAMGIDMIPIAQSPQGPDLDAVAAHLVADPSIRGLVGVPRHANPSGAIWSEPCLQRLMAMCAERGGTFALLLDHAYALHDIVPAPPTPDLMRLATDAHCADAVAILGSTSKLAHPGAGFGFVALSPANRRRFADILQGMTLGSDKTTQLRQVQFFQEQGGVRAFYQKQLAPLLRACHEQTQRLLARHCQLPGISWSHPRGGFFVTLHLGDAISAKQVVALAGKAGLALTPAGATMPYGADREDNLLRLAPTGIDPASLAPAMELLGLCLRLAPTA